MTETRLDPNVEFFNLLCSKNIRLNQQQNEAVVTTEGPIMMLAVPGSGKTTVIVSRIGYLIKVKKIIPKRIITLTFSRASADDMKKRFEKVFKNEINTDEVKFSTIHSFAFIVLMNYMKNQGTILQVIEGDGIISTQGKTITKSIILRHLFQKHNNNYISEDEYAELCRELGYIKNKMIQRQDFTNMEFNTSKFEEIYDEYESVKKTNNWIDYDDMLVLCYEILKNNPSVLQYYANQYDYIQIDEGQDTSKIQHAIVDLLVSKFESKNLFIVGDEDQSIYGFRGAEPEYMLKFKERFPEATILFMEQNYRSSKEIVGLANIFIKKNKLRFNKNLQTENEISSEIIIMKHSDPEAQVRYVISDILDRGIQNQTAIIYRNNVSAIPFVSILREKEIPFYVRDFDENVFSHWAIEDILDILRFAKNPTDFSIFSKIYYKIETFLNKESVKFFEKLYEKAQKTRKSPINVLEFILNECNLEEYKKENIERAYRYLRMLSKAEDITEQIYIVRNRLRYDAFLERKFEDSPNAFNNVRNIIELLEQMGNGVKTIEELKEKIETLLSTVKKENKKNKNKEVLVLTTKHSSKGLEFDNVYMIDLLEERIPKTIIDEEDQKKVEEERRLFYVGMTRAKERLIFNTYLKNGDKQTNPSTFLGEVESILRKPENTEKIERPKFNPQFKQTKPIPVFSPTVKAEHSTGTPTNVQLREKMIINHMTFGKGTIMSISFAGDSIMVKFDKSGIKKMTSEEIMQNCIITKI